MICATALDLRLNMMERLYVYASLAMAKIRNKSKTISLPTAELHSIKDGTNVAKIIQRLFNIKK